MPTLKAIAPTIPKKLNDFLKYSTYPIIGKPSKNILKLKLSILSIIYLFVEL